MISALGLVLLSASTPTVSLSLAEVLRQTVLHQPALVSARELTRQAQARRMQIASIDYPQVAATAELFGATANNTATSYLTPPDFVRVGTRPASKADVPAMVPFLDTLAGVGVHYELLDFGYAGAVVDGADARVEAAGALEEKTTADALLRSAEAYFSAAAADEALRVAQDAERRALTHHELAAAAVSAGLRGQIDLVRSNAETAAARLAVIRAKNATRVARAALDAAIGWEVDPAAHYGFEGATSIALGPLPSEAEATQRALERRPDVRALDAQLRAAAFQERAAVAGNYPRILASASLSVRGFDAVPDTVNWDVGLVLSLPIFTGFLTRGATLEAEAASAELSARASSLRQTVIFQVQQARNTLASAEEAIRASESQVEAAALGLSMAETRYAKGLGNIVELADAQAQEGMARIGLIESHLSAALSWAQLQHAMSGLTPP
ncbi:MAG: TolC family protein [Myxococcota bacterium]